MHDQEGQDRGQKSRTTSSEVRRRALQQAGAGVGPQAGSGGRIRASEKRRYVFQVWTCAAFAVVWVLVAVLSGSWLFLALAAGFAVLAAVAAWCLVILRRRAESAEGGSAGAA